MGLEHRRRTAGASHQCLRLISIIAFCAYSISLSVSQIPEKARSEELHDTREQSTQGTESKPADLFLDLGQMDERMKKRQQKVEPTSRTTVQMEKKGKALLIKDFRKFQKSNSFRPSTGTN
jgi:hypothetical protein